MTGAGLAPVQKCAGLMMTLQVHRFVGSALDAAGRAASIMTLTLTSTRVVSIMGLVIGRVAIPLTLAIVPLHLWALELSMTLAPEL